MNITLMNCSNECGNFETGEVIPLDVRISPILLMVALIHCCIVIVLGSLGNGVALWCVVRCPNTMPAMKVLLCSVFAPLLVICLVTRPAVAHIITAIITCNPANFFTKFRVVTTLVYSSLAGLELVAIAAVAFFRMLAVCGRGRHSMSTTVAVVIVVSMSVYSVVTSVGLLGSVVLRWVWEPYLKRVIFIVYFFFITMLPILVTGASYAYIIFTVQENKRRLARSQQSCLRVHNLVDQATRAMLAVFISNLLFGLPHAVYHLLHEPSFTLNVVIHIIFSTHFVVDPVVFVWYNQSYRRRVGELACSGLTWMMQCCTTRNSPTTNQSSSCTKESICNTEASSSTKESSFLKKSSCTKESSSTTESRP
nr:uncharacterized protein LOC123758789 [Procambarus clarkii]